MANAASEQAERLLSSTGQGRRSSAIGAFTSLTMQLTSLGKKPQAQRSAGRRRKGYGHPNKRATTVASASEEAQHEILIACDICHKPGLDLSGCHESLADFRRFCRELDCNARNSTAGISIFSKPETTIRLCEQWPAGNEQNLAVSGSKLPTPARAQQEGSPHAGNRATSPPNRSESDDGIAAGSEFVDVAENDNDAESLKPCPCCPRQLLAHRECIRVWHSLRAHHSLSAGIRDDAAPGRVTPSVLQILQLLKATSRAAAPAASSGPRSELLREPRTEATMASTKSDMAEAIEMAEMSASSNTTWLGSERDDLVDGASAREHKAQDEARQQQQQQQQDHHHHGGTLSDIKRRLRSVITPPRLHLPSMRRLNDRDAFSSLSRSATSSPVDVGATADGGDRRGLRRRRDVGSKSCDDLQRMEGIFEPRLAPYTPATRPAASPQLNESSIFRTFTPEPSAEDEGERHRLEAYLFEPRDVVCTPPLRSPLAHQQALRPQSTGCGLDALRVPDLSPRQKRRSFPGYAFFDGGKPAERAPLSENELRRHVQQRRSTAEEASRAIMGMNLAGEGGTDSAVFDPAPPSSASTGGAVPPSPSSPDKLAGRSSSPTTVNADGGGGGGHGGGDLAFVRATYYRRSAEKTISPLAKSSSTTTAGMTSPPPTTPSSQQRTSADSAFARSSARSSTGRGSGRRKTPVREVVGGGDDVTDAGSGGGGSPVLTIRHLERISTALASASSSLASTPIPPDPDAQQQQQQQQQQSGSQQPLHARPRSSRSSDSSTSSGSGAQAVLAVC